MTQFGCIMTKWKCVVLLLMVFCFVTNAQGLQLKRANSFYKAGAYSKAIPLFESILKENESNQSIKVKLANCYRIINKWDKAEPLLANIVQSERAKPIDWYNYAEALLCNGKYDDAKLWVGKCLAEDPNDEKAKLLFATCDKVRDIEPVYQFVAVKPFEFNSAVDEGAPVLFKHKLVFSSDRKLSFNPLRYKSGQTGRDFLRIYVSESTDNYNYSEPKQYSSRLNSLNKNTANASFTADGTQVIFSRNCDELSKNGTFNLQLYQASTTEDDNWKMVTVLPFCSPEFNYMHPYINPDGTEIYFTSDKGDSEGGTDLYVSQRRNDTWSKPINLGTTINTKANEGFPFIDNDGNLYFCSKGHPGYGGFDIFMSERTPEGEFLAPVNIGLPINSVADDISLFLNEDLSSGIFTSNREGNDDDIYFFSAFDSANDMQTFLETVSGETKEPIPTEYQDILSPRGSAGEMAVHLSPERVLQIADSIANLPFRTTLDMQWLLKYKQPVENFRFILPNATYLQDQVTVTPSIASELDRIAAMLNQFSTIIIEVGSHTASLGDDDQNQLVSQHRAEIIVEYLVFKGISPLRLEYHGYGETLPRNNCTNGINCSYEEHSINQRIEIKVLKE